MAQAPRRFATDPDQPPEAEPVAPPVPMVTSPEQAPVAAQSPAQTALPVGPDVPASAAVADVPVQIGISGHGRLTAVQANILRQRVAALASAAHEAGLPLRVDFSPASAPSQEAP